MKETGLSVNLDPGRRNSVVERMEILAGDALEMVDFFGKEYYLRDCGGSVTW